MAYLLRSDGSSKVLEANGVSGILLAGTTTPVVGSYDRGFSRDSSGALVRGGAASGIISGFLRDSTGALVFGTSSPYRYEDGFLRDSNYALVEGTTIDHTLNGLPRDSSGALVTVAEGSAAAPTKWVNGWLFDANGKVVVSS